MRRRLVVVYVSLLVVACLGLALPLCGAIAAGNTADMVMDRSNDTVRFASMAGPALESGETEALRSELDAYDSLYRIRAAVVDHNGDIVVSSRSGFETNTPETAGLIRAGLAGNRGGVDGVLWPWDGRPLVVVEPIARSGEVVGAVVTGALAVLVALADGGLVIGLDVLGLVLAVQQLESNVLEPIILGRAIHLHQVVVLLAITAGALLLGILGAFLAVPLAAIVAQAVDYLRHEAGGPRGAGAPAPDADTDDREPAPARSA
jgi:hypothetical protein